MSMKTGQWKLPKRKFKKDEREHSCTAGPRQRQDIQVFGTPERENRPEEIFEARVAENFPKSIQTPNCRFKKLRKHKARTIPNKNKNKNHIGRRILFQL